MLVLGMARPALLERRPDWPGRADALRIDARRRWSADESHSLAAELLKKLAGGAAGAARAPHRRRRGQSVLHGRADQDAGRRGRDRHRRRAAGPLVARQAASRRACRRPSPACCRPGSTASSRTRSWPAAGLGDRLRVLGPGAGGDRSRRAPRRCPALHRRELVVPHPRRSLDGVREYAFQHQLLHQVTYGTVLKRLRRGYHARAAAWLARPDRGARQRLPRRWRPSTTRRPATAAQRRRILRPRRRARRQRYANETVAAHVARALALIEGDAAPESLRLRFRLLAVRERALDMQGRRAEQRTDVEAMEALAEQIDDDRLRADAAKRRSSYSMRTADSRAQVDAARRARDWAERAGDIELELRAQNLMASGLCDLGDVAAGRALALDGLAAARAHGLRRVEGSFLNTLVVDRGAARRLRRPSRVGSAAMAAVPRHGRRTGAGGGQAPSWHLAARRGRGGAGRASTSRKAFAWRVLPTTG